MEYSFVLHLVQIYNIGFKVFLEYLKDALGEIFDHVFGETVHDETMKSEFEEQAILS